MGLGMATIAACSDSEGDTTTSGSGAVSAASSTVSAGGSTSSSGATGAAGGMGGSATTSSGGGGVGTGGTGGAAGDCSMQPDKQKCTQCCAAQTGGYEAFLTALLLACGCDPGMGPMDPSPCLGDCDVADPNNDACTGAGMVSLMAFGTNTACQTCIGGLGTNEACFGNLAANCDASCKSYVACVQMNCN